MSLPPVFTATACLLHDPGRFHPEAPSRLEIVRAHVAAADPNALREAAPASREALLRVHPEEYLTQLETLAAAGGGRLDPDTALNAASWDAARGAAGAALAALESALEGRPAFAAIRPPGHHAFAARAMGFCLLNNVVIAAREAQARGRDRVLIVDWDVHHGNGTQGLVEQDPTIRYVSLHQWPHYPYTGASTERGVGNVFNLPCRAGLAPEQYVEALWHGIGQVTADWTPAVILVSAGFDSMAGDLLGGFTLEPEHYAEWTRRLRERFPQAPIAGVLEGGYVPGRLADGVLAHLGALAG